MKRCASILVIILAFHCQEVHGQDITTVLPGKWGTKEGGPAGFDFSCEGNFHTIQFSSDEKRLFLEFQREVEGDRGGKLAEYEVLAVEEDSLKLKMEREDRLDESGKEVLWKLVMFGHNEYAWNRSDWPETGFTGAFVRCDT